MSLQISDEQARAINALAGGSSEIKEYCLSILANRKEPVEIETPEEFEESYKRSLAIVKDTVINTPNKGSFVVKESSGGYAAMKCINTLGLSHSEAIKVLLMVSERTEKQLKNQ